jgi:hypothetical protein
MALVPPLNTNPGQTRFLGAIFQFRIPKKRVRPQRFLIWSTLALYSAEGLWRNR